MARVNTQKNARQNGGPGNNRGSQVAKQHQQRANKNQKVVLEKNNQGKGSDRNVVSKRIQPAARGRRVPGRAAHRYSQLSFQADPPPGYTFIPAGNPQLTRALKEFAQRGNYKIFSVSTTPHAARHELSREVHRIGFHFPTSVVAQVCNHYGIRLTRAGRVIDEKQNDNFMKVYQKGQLVLDEKIEDQVTINTEAKETIRDLFPNIPDNDLFQIIKTAFQLGDGKVGTADEIPLTRRATLSVVAHIRHGYTRYDKLLRRMAYNNARHEVEAETLKKLVEWRGDGTADSGAINDILDDVIVISDEEKSDDERPGVRQEYQNEVRVEELDGSAYWPAGARPLSPLRLVDDAPQGYRYVPETAYGYRPTEQEIAIRERNRAARWEQAKQEYRSTLTQAGPAYQRVVVREPSPVRHLVPSDAPYGRVIEREYLGPDRPDEIQVISRPPSAGYARPAHVRYEPIQGEAEYRPMYHAQSRPLSPVRVNNRRRSASPRTETIMPSIEGPNGAYSPSVVRTSGEVRYDGHHARPNNLYRERDDHRNGRSSPINIPQIQPSGFARSQHGPISQDHSPYLQPEAMQIINSGAEYINQPPVQQRVVVQGNDTRFHQNQTVRVNPFQERYIGSERRLEPLQTQTYRRLQDAQQATPPRRILEPISDPYSDSGPQRYREFLPVTESHFASSAPTTSQYLPERRIIYANPPEEYVTTTRYEPLR